ncbi:cysteine proteinase, partial [Coemansia reversa NRRL 1564]
MGSRSTHIDALLAKQGRADKLLLRRRVEFRLATQTDAKMDLLRKKYKPINSNSAGGRTGKANGASSDLQLDASASAQNGHGLDERSGFRRAAHSLFPAEQLAAGWQTMRPIGPGLSNLGNTCFLNSVLQCLTYTPPLAEHMLTREHSAGCRVGESCMLCRFEAHVVRALSKREGSSISPKAIVGRLKLVAKHMRVGRQEDAHEFLRLLVDAFQRSLLTGIDPKIDRRIQETTLTHQVFGGYLQSQVSCGRCGYDSNTFDPLLDISLDIQGGSTIEKALRSFTRPETLTTSNRYRCEKCNKLVDATKQMTIYQLPRILTLQLKRFSVFGGGKIGRYVEFPLNLNMKSYVSRNSPERASYDYTLYAVLVHAGGTSRSGHYYCFVKSPAGVWYELNDSTVHQVSERTVLRQSAYMLFYQRCAA